MKIELEHWEDVRDFVRMMDPALLRAWNPGLDNKIKVESLHTTQLEVIDAQEKCGLLSAVDAMERRLDLRVAEDAPPDGLPTDIPAPLAASMDTAVAETSAALRDEVRQLDADGAPHNTDWHSDPPKINADGRWRARRKRDEDAYKAWLQEQAVTAETAIAADAEPVATETHALPQDEQSEGAFRAAASRETASAETNEMTDKLIAEVRAALDVDLAALVEASQEAALDASDSHMDLIKACQAFISYHGHPAYNALKAAVAPLEGAENGKAVPQFTPGERRLMRACIENYPTHKEV